MGRRRSSRSQVKSGTALTEDHAVGTSSIKSPNVSSNKTEYAVDDDDISMKDLVESQQEIEHEDEDDDEETSLARLSQNYRRYSETRKEFERDADQDFVEDDEEENNGDDDDGHGNSYNESLYENDEDHYNKHYHHDDNEDDEDSQNEHSENDEDDDHMGMSDAMLENAFRSLANRLGRGDDLSGGQRGDSTDRPHSNNAASNRQRIMEQLFPGAANLLGGFSSGMATRMNEYVRVLQNNQDPYLMLETLNELSERLLMMNGAIAEHTIPSFELSRAIVGILEHPFFQEDLELQLVACRCLYNLLEVNEQFVKNAVRAGVIEALQAKLAEISYIDLAEQALQTLEFISRFSGIHVFRKNAVTCSLMYLDFLTIHAQRKAISIAANSVKHIKTSEYYLVEDILPILQRIVIEFTDTQELETAWLAIALIIKNFRNNSEYLEKLVTSDLVNQMLSVIGNTETNLSTSLKLIRSLSSCAQNNQIAKLIISNGKFSSAIFSILSKYKKTNEEKISINTLMTAPKDLMLGILELLLNLLPVEPNSVFTRNTTVEGTTRRYDDIKAHYISLVSDLFPLLIDIYSSTVLFEVRRYVLGCIINIIASVDKTEDVTNDHASLINLLASIVIQNKSAIRSDNQDIRPYVSLLGALILTKLLIHKSSDTFIQEFEREGLLADTTSLSEILRNHPHFNADHISDGQIENDVNEDNNEEEDNDDVEEEEEEEEEESDEDGQNEEEEEEEEEGEEEEEEEEDSDDDSNTSDYDEQTQHLISQVPSKSPFKTLTIPQVLIMLTKYVTDIDQVYLSKRASSCTSKLEHLRLLDELNADLSDDILLSTYTYNDMIRIWGSLKEALYSKDSSVVISSFELISSGIIPVIGSIFKRFDSSSMYKTSFMDAFKERASTGEPALVLLIKKLQESLTRSESFEIINCGLKTGENRASSLAKHLKVKLTAIEDTEGDFQSMKEFIILVHAIASFGNVSGFLKRKIDAINSLGARRRQLFPGEDSGDQDSEQEDDNLDNEELGSGNSNDWYIEFLLNDRPISPDTTVFGALYKDKKEKESSTSAHKFWHEPHEITFRKVKGAISTAGVDDRYPPISEKEYLASQNIDEKDTTLEILDLLKSLHEFENISKDAFLNYKLTAKLNRQLEEPLVVASGILPNWSVYITRKYSFLFPLETRLFFLQSTSFGYSRLVQLWSNKVAQESASNPGSAGSNTIQETSLPLGRPTRHKVRVSRSHILQICFKVLDKLGSHPSVLEVEFNDEVGTGLGPTLEFYASCSHAFASKSLGIWRDVDEDKSSEYITGALFPSPLQPSDDKGYKEKINHFRYLGKFVARALLDNRILDLNFNKVFFELIALQIADQDYELSTDEQMNKLSKVDVSLAKSLTYLLEHREEVKDLSLNFTLPGSTIDLVPNGSETLVDSSNVDDYVAKVLNFALNEGIKEQLEHFVIGFSEVFQFFSMLVFTPDELTQLFGNIEEDWSYETLLSSIHADHGYSLDSPTVQDLISVMSRLSKEDRRLLLQFLTGSPRLPIGGFKNLKPDFTVVLKHSEDGLKPDDVLPSVMTCANYLKLPNYSSIEILEQRLRQAFNEGAGAFLLS